MLGENGELLVYFCSNMKQPPTASATGAVVRVFEGVQHPMTSASGKMETKEGSTTGTSVSIVHVDWDGPHHGDRVLLDKTL